MIKGFEPIIDEKCQMLILGTMPSAESIRKQEYYGNGRNQFWKIIFSLFGQQVYEVYDRKKDFLLSNHIAIWDVLENCEREGSSDSSIKNVKVNDFEYLLNQYPNIKTIYFNGKTAEKLYKRFVDKNISNGVSSLMALPSTSPANTIKLEVKEKEWRKILQSLNGVIDSNVL